MAERIMVKKLKIKGRTFRLTLDVPKDRRICEAVLVYRNIVRPKEYALQLEEKNGEILVYGDISGREPAAGDWDVFLKDKDGNKQPVILDETARLRLILGNFEINTKEGLIFFPMGSTDNMLTFRCRNRSEYDGFLTQMKIVFAYICWLALKSFWKKKRIWLVYEKFSREAQDNGFYFFRYCMEELPEKERKRIFYIMDKNSEQWDKTAKYSKQILPFMSFKHMVYLLAARVYVASDAKAHSFIWNPKPNLIKREISRKPILFLQHGVLALKRVENIFGKDGASPMTHFTVSSKFEQDIVTENFGYAQEDVPILGLCRWDVLENRASEKEKKILIMPTWRSWLEEQSNEVFTNSQYCKCYRSLLENRELEEFLKKHKVKLIFHIHPKMREYLNAFQEKNESVELIPHGSRQLNELIMECSMLITDYSSVSWDAYYLGKPVIFYQFDYELYMKAHGSYIDMEKELFGDRCLTENELAEKIKEYVRNDFAEKERYGVMRKERFAYTDKNNCRRTMDYLKSKGY